MDKRSPHNGLKLVLSGLGGQGVIFATRLLAQTGLSLGWSVIASETHGMSQRGGSVLSHLKVGGTESPLIRRGTADVLLALEPDEAVRSLPFLRPGGVGFVDAEDWLRSEVADHLERLNIQIHVIAASRTALELGAAPVANVVLIGFAAAHPALPLPIEALERTLADIVPRGREVNLRALQAGYQHGRAAFARSTRSESRKAER